MENTKEITNMSSEKMRNMPIGKLIFSMSMPAIFSMIVQALYNIVDSLFVTNITSVSGVNYLGEALGKDSFTAISIAFPIVLLVNALGIGIAVGTNVYIARKLGEGNRDKADCAAKTAIIMVVISWIVVSLAGILFAEDMVRPFINSSNSSDVNYVVEQATLYLVLYMVGCIGFFIEIVCNRVLQATGNMIVPMVCQLIGAISNIILDAVFILGFKMGVLGAIVATVAGQWLAAIFVIVVFIVRKHDVSLNFKGFKVEGKYFSRIVKMAVPAFTINALSSIIMLYLNNLLKDGNGIIIFSAYFKVQSFVFMAVFGLMQGSVPILGFNYGANIKHRFNQALKVVSVSAIIMMSVGTLVFMLFPGAIMSAFSNGDQLLIKEGAYAFRVLSLSFIPAGFGILLINILQSVNKAFSSFVLTLARQLVFLLPLATILYSLGQLNLVWYSYAISEVVSVLIFIPIAIKQINKQFEYKNKQYEQGLLDSAM